MAKLNPTLDVINRQKVKPTEGEMTLLKFLLSNLDDSFEVFFQPLLNGDFPDIVIMKKGYGVLIIEVKDWELNKYKLDNKGKWHIINNDTKIISPFEQVREYKYNLFTLHSEELFNLQIKDPSLWNTVKCAVYFHKPKATELRHFLFDGVRNDNYEGFMNNYFWFGNDSLTQNGLNQLLHWASLSTPSSLFTPKVYESFLRYLQSPIHKIEEGINIIYTKEQQELIRSEVKPRRKIKGVAGSGKTLVLAKRAVNSHIRTGGTVLILTYNIALKNYIRDKISDVREEFNWRYFYITNYHHFFKTNAYRYHVPLISLDCWEDVDFFEEVKDNIVKYDVVLIDETQDYLQEWINIIVKYFTHDDTEFIVFGDEKQNIYDRQLDENKEIIVKSIRGRWNNSMNKSYRLTNRIANLAIKFQNQIFKQKYNNDDIISMSSIDFQTRVLQYHYFTSYNSDNLFNVIYDVLDKNKIHSSDVGILSSKIELLRDIDYSIRNSKHENTNLGFESKEEFEKYGNNKSKIEDIRRIRKFHFYMKSGTVKLSTVHSFKGWEIDTLFLIIDKDKSFNISTAELIYTGITRARRNLIIINLANDQYHDFFNKEIEDKFIHNLPITTNKDPFDDLPF